MKMLHPIQKELVELLKKNIDEPLTVRELQDKLTLSSPSLVQHHIIQLEKKGYLRRNPANPRDYEVLSDSPERTVSYINLYGLAQCGPNGSVLDGNPIDRVPVSTRHLGMSATDAFLVKAKGDSMSPRIKQGDLVIAKRSQVAQTGDLVVCVNNGMALIKQLKKIDNTNHYILHSLNIEYNDFFASDDFRVEGVVKGVISYNI